MNSIYISVPQITTFYLLLFIFELYNLFLWSMFWLYVSPLQLLADPPYFHTWLALCSFSLSEKWKSKTRGKKNRTTKRQSFWFKKKMPEQNKTKPHKKWSLFWSANPGEGTCPRIWLIYLVIFHLRKWIFLFQILSLTSIFLVRGGTLWQLPLHTDGLLSSLNLCRFSVCLHSLLVHMCIIPTCCFLEVP